MSSSNSVIPLMGYIGIGISGVIALSALCFCIFYLAKPKRRKPLVPAGQLVPPRPLIPSFKVPSFGSGRRQQRGDTPSILPDSTVQALPSLSSPPHSALSLSNTSSSMHSARPDSSSEASQLGSSRSWFTFEELQAATDNFPMVNLLGEGGFGCVYKGTLLGGQVVAVKQLKVGGGQGEREFRAEVEIISRVHHRHLVSLVGYCVAESQRLLVYEYVPNGTLEYHLHGKGRPVMDWQTRQKIAVGTSRGIAYLHEDCHPRIIHRDIKSSNILLDSNFEALVSDFGLAKLTSDTNTHVSTRVVGTFGYLAPEYASTGKLTEKSDVFSFGVVLLELITGQKPVDSALLIEEGLVEWSRPLLIQAQEENNLKVIADPKLNGNYNEKEMMRMIEVAAACVRHSTRKRPRMSLVVRALEEEVTISGLNKGVKPGHSSLHGQSYGESMDYDSAQYRVDMGKMRQLALGTSQEYGSEYSRSTSEYGAKSSSYSSDQSSMEVAPKPTSPPAKSARNSSSSNEMNA